MAVSKVSTKPPLAPGGEAIVEIENSFVNQILILISAPLLTEDFLPVKSLSIQKEIEEIVLVLEDIPEPISVEIVVKVATSRTLQDVLASSVKPLIIHFISHGMKQDETTALVLEDEVGLTRFFSEEDLKIAVSNLKQPPCQLALLNACHSEKLAQAFVESGVDHVIAVNAEDEILDEAARCFSRRLYQALFNRDTIADSFLVSRNAVKLDDKLRKLFNFLTLELGVNFDEAFKFRLLPQAPHNQSLRIEKSSLHHVIYPQWLKTNIPRNDPNFVGRRQEIHRVIKEFVDTDKRCITLHGMGGIGKTALAYAIGQWLHERERYQDGVWFINLRDTDSVGTLITKVKQSLELRSFNLEKELKNSRVFLILDDLDKLIKTEIESLVELLNSLLEQCPKLRLLLTCRDSLVRDILYCHQEEVCSMGAEETRKIFQKYAPKQAKWGDNEDLEQDFKLLVKFLDGYPLAIKLAASYMAETEYTLKMLCEDLIDVPMEVFDSYSPEQRKEKSLRLTLERSFEMLSVESQDIFPLLAFFPSGLSREIARAIWGRKGNKALLELFKFSMAEKSPTALDWRVNIPEPARNYAESKLQKGRGINYLAPLVLDFYNDKLAKEVIDYFDKGNENKGRQLLLQENSNLTKFLQWGYDYEESLDNICRSARITALLSPYWRWIEPNQDPLTRLDLALGAAKRNQDKEGQDLVIKALSTINLNNRGEFKDIQTLKLEEADTTFEFEFVKVNKQGDIIEKAVNIASYYKETLPNNIEVDMIHIRGGELIMGSDDDEEGRWNAESPQHRVKIADFYMSQTPITQAQWQAIASVPQVETKIELSPTNDGDDHPVRDISWHHAIEWCARLSKYTGRQYRLPSEAEWEYACRGFQSPPVSLSDSEDTEGENTINTKVYPPFHFGDTITDKLANYCANETYGDEPKGEYRANTTPVRSYKPNAFGLYDLHGNVWEWCLDPWHSDYNGAPSDGRVWDKENQQEDFYQDIVKNIKQLLTDGRSHVIRGGSYDNNPRPCRSAYRGNTVARDVLGFRVVCVPPRT